MRDVGADAFNPEIDDSRSARSSNPCARPPSATARPTRSKHEGQWPEGAFGGSGLPQLGQVSV